MKLVPLNTMFDIQYGNQFDLYKLDSDFGGDINFISRSSQNLGVMCKVYKYNFIEPFPAGLITVTLGGTYLLSSFVQQDKFYTAQNIKVLTPKKEMSFSEKIFYCKAIELNRKKYTSHGREANKTLDTLLVPEKVPENFRKVKIGDIDNITKKPVCNEIYKLDIKSWKYFELAKLFKIKKGERITTYNRTKDDKNIPLVVASSENNGVVDFISYADFKFEKQVFKQKITIDMFFNVFYHDYEYFSDDNVHTLFPKFNINKYIAFFIVSILKQSNYKYSFGRQARLHRIDKENIKLPTKNNKPDFEFMENYIKSLPYSSNL